MSRRTDLGRSRLQGFWANSGRQAWLPACLLGPFACLRFSHLSVSLLAPHSPHAASAGTGASRPVPPTSLSTTSVPAHTGLHGCTPPLPSQRIPETSPSPCGRQRWRTSASGVQPWGRDSSVSVLHRTWTSDVRDSGALQAAGGSQGARAASGPPAGEGSQESRCRAGPDQTCGPGRCCTPPPQAGSGEGAAGSNGRTGHGVRARPLPPGGRPAQDYVGCPSAPPGADGSPVCRDAGLVFLTRVPPGHSPAQPPRTGLATSLLACRPCPGGTRWQAVGRGLCTRGDPDEGRTSLKLAPGAGGQAEPKPTLAGTGPGGSEPREGARRPAAAARGWAGRGGSGVP